MCLSLLQHFKYLLNFLSLFHEIDRLDLIASAWSTGIVSGTLSFSKASLLSRGITASSSSTSRLIVSLISSTLSALRCNVFKLAFEDDTRLVGTETRLMG